MIEDNSYRKNRNKYANIKEVLKCWKEHFQEHLNKQSPHKQSAIDEINENNHPKQLI